MIRRLQHSAPAQVERRRVVRRGKYGRFPVEPNVEIDRVLPLLRAKRGDGRGDVSRRRLERIAAQRGDRVFPLAIALPSSACGSARVRRWRGSRASGCPRPPRHTRASGSSDPARCIRRRRRRRSTSTRCSAGRIAGDSGRTMRRCPARRRRRCTARRCRDRPRRTGQRQVHRREECSAAVERDGDAAVVRDAERSGSFGSIHMPWCRCARLSAPRRDVLPPSFETCIASTRSRRDPGSSDRRGLANSRMGACRSRSASSTSCRRRCER